MTVSELINKLKNQDPNARVLVNIFDDNKSLRKTPIRTVAMTDTGLRLHPITYNGKKIGNFSLSGGDERIVFLT